MAHKRNYRVDAFRLLALMVAGAVDRDGSKVFEGEKRLQAMDFWMRYPDYLANELLNRFDSERDELYLNTARQIFDDEEPTLRRLEMPRWRFGAYENSSDALSLLKTYGIISIEPGPKIVGQPRNDFKLTDKAITIIRMNSAQSPKLEWYVKRAQVVAQLAGSSSGAALKKMQYEMIEYAATKLGGVIPSIAEDVRLRLSNYAGNAAIVEG